MTITLELTPEQQHRLEDGTACHDRDAVRRVLLQAVDATVDTLLERPTEAQQSEEVFDTLSQRLTDQMAATAVAEHRPLSDKALTREAIYGEHL